MLSDNASLRNTLSVAAALTMVERSHIPGFTSDVRSAFGLGVLCAANKADRREPSRSATSAGQRRGAIIRGYSRSHSLQSRRVSEQAVATYVDAGRSQVYRTAVIGGG